MRVGWEGMGGGDLGDRAHGWKRALHKGRVERTQERGGGERQLFGGYSVFGLARRHVKEFSVQREGVTSRGDER